MNNLQDFWEQQRKERLRLHHRVTVYYPFGELDPVIQWAKENLNKLWKWELIQIPGDSTKGQYIFHFEDDKDLELFCLRWL